MFIYRHLEIKRRIKNIKKNRLRVQPSSSNEESLRGDVPKMAGRCQTYVRVVLSRDDVTGHNIRLQQQHRHSTEQFQGHRVEEEKRQYIQIAVAFLPASNVRRVLAPLQVIYTYTKDYSNVLSCWYICRLLNFYCAVSLKKCGQPYLSVKMLLWDRDTAMYPIERHLASITASSKWWVPLVSNVLECDDHSLNLVGI